MHCASLWNPIVARCAHWLDANVPEFNSLTEQCLSVLPIEAVDADSCDKEYFTQHANSLLAICGDSGCSSACAATVVPLVARCGDSIAAFVGVAQHLRPFAERCAADGNEEILRATFVLGGRESSRPDRVAAFLDTLVAALDTNRVSVWASQVLGRPDHAVITVMIVADADAGGAQALAARLETLFSDPSSALMTASAVDSSQKLR